MKIILASHSPRRKALLEQMGLAVSCVPSDFEEYFNNENDAQEQARILALGKAEKVAQEHPKSIVIGGDTIVLFNGKQLGKPDSPDEARKMLKAYSGNLCEITSSVAVVCMENGYEQAYSDTAIIVFGPVSNQDIDNYIATGDYADKAGGFAVQHPLVKALIMRIEGRMDTIIGLPTHHLSSMLADFSIRASPVETYNPPAKTN